MSEARHSGKEIEAQFLRDRETHLAILRRRNELLGLWAARCLGMWGKGAEAYAAAA